MFQCRALLHPSLTSLSIYALCVFPHTLSFSFMCVCVVFINVFIFINLKLFVFYNVKQLFIYGMLHFCHWNIGFIFWKRKSYLVCLSAIWFCLFRKQLKLFYFFIAIWLLVFLLWDFFMWNSEIDFAFWPENYHISVPFYLF